MISKQNLTVDEVVGLNEPKQPEETPSSQKEQIINNKDVIDINFNIYSRHYKLMKE